MKTKLMFVSLLAAAGCAFGEIWLPKIFSDNMVLQCGEPVKIWGKAAPNAKVAVLFGGVKGQAVADNAGKWSLKLPAMQPDSNPKQITVSENGKAQKHIKNVLVGEVWICGGQSNMDWNLGSCPAAYAVAVKEGNKPLLRSFIQKHDALASTAQEDFPEGAAWVVCTPQTVGRYSAIGYAFGKRLCEKLNIPVGLIRTAMGGASMVAFLPYEDAEQGKGYKEFLKYYDRLAENYDYENALNKYEKALAKYEAKKAAAKRENKEFKEDKPNKPLEETPLSVQNTPAFLYNAKVAPLCGYGVRGVLWYQGEGDFGQPQIFADKFKTLVAAWRKHFEMPNLPFYTVQLTSFDVTTHWRESENWQQTRFEQFNCFRQMDNVEMAVILDLGEKNQIHPQRKDEVGERLFNIALKNIYGKKDIKGEHSPMFKSAKFNKNRALVEFDMYASKLVLKGKAQGFEVKIDNSWQTAEKVLVNDLGTVEVFAPQDSEISGVRYLWKSWALPEICLYNTQGLPAMSFKAEK